MRRIFETAVILLGTLGWWGFVYPELSLLESSQEAEYVCEAQEDAINENGDDRTDGLGAEIERAEYRTDGIRSNRKSAEDENAENSGTGEIRIKSKIAEYICQVRKNTAAEKEVQDDKQKRAHRGF